MECLLLLKDLLQEGDYMCKIDLYDAYFTIHYLIKSKVLGGNTVRVYLPLLRIKPSTSYIYKINEGPYCATSVPKHSPNNIPGRLMSRSVQELIFHRDTVIGKVRYLQSLQSQVLKLSKYYNVKVSLNKDAKDDPFWWLENLMF